MTVERDRDWYRKQIDLLQQEIDRIQGGRIQEGDRLLGECLAELDACSIALVEAGGEWPRPSPRGFH